MVRAYLSIGSNLGDREENCEAALKRLAATGNLRVVKRSPVYWTEPMDGASGGAFVNLAVEVETSLSPRALLAVLQGIEAELGRTAGHLQPRPIDLDLLLYEDVVLRDPDLEIPHPRLETRRFVLAPLNDIAPGLRHPVSRRTVAELLLALGAEGGRVRRLA
jgi:2-amino-4-hydroxy-6-hydroxymethyldihydropteridine diphosphokinase